MIERGREGKKGKERERSVVEVRIELSEGRNHQSLRERGESS